MSGDRRRSRLKEAATGTSRDQGKITTFIEKRDRFRRRREQGGRSQQRRFRHSHNGADRTDIAGPIGIVIDRLLVRCCVIGRTGLSES